MSTRRCLTLSLMVATVQFSSLLSVHANLGPFRTYYPSYDAGPKGVIAQIDRNLLPSRETRLKVKKEDLTISLGNFSNEDNGSPRAKISATYEIENPESKAITVDFGFPVLRSSSRLLPTITAGNGNVDFGILSDDVIHGVIRDRSRGVIDQAIRKRAALSKLITKVRDSEGSARVNARRDLSNYLVKTMKWTVNDAALLVEFASCYNPAYPNLPKRPLDARPWVSISDLQTANLGVLEAIGAQKATQFLALLATKLDPKAAVSYEQIFKQWGGDIRDMSVDMTTGKIRPRILRLELYQIAPLMHPILRQDPNDSGAPMRSAARLSLDQKDNLSISIVDSTLYARIDYFQPIPGMTEADKASCQAILKNLPVVFTFAPMDIICYSVTFQPKSTQKVTVSYDQQTNIDTGSPMSYQLAYVLHPASLWKNFGPINVDITLPPGVRLKTSRPSVVLVPPTYKADVSMDAYHGQLTDRTGVLYIGVNTEDWQNLPDLYKSVTDE